MSEELKPCPFCGSEAETLSKGSNFIIVGCRYLSCQVRPTVTCYESIGDKYNFYAWNKRFARTT